jgi:hypothetical protein
MPPSHYPGCVGGQLSYCVRGVSLRRAWTIGRSGVVRDAKIRGAAELSARVVLAIAAIAVGACSSGNALLPPVGTGAMTTAALPSDHSGKPIVVSLAPIVGAPQTFLEPFVRQLNDKAGDRDVVLIVDATVTADYTLRGYIISETQRDGAKLLYVWDLLDKTGTRINRITGEEPLAATGGSGDAWSKASDATRAAIASHTIEGIVSSVAQASGRAAKG